MLNADVIDWLMTEIDFARTLQNGRTNPAETPVEDQLAELKRVRELHVDTANNQLMLLINRIASAEKPYLADDACDDDLTPDEVASADLELDRAIAALEAYIDRNDD